MFLISFFFASTRFARVCEEGGYYIDEIDIKY